MAPETEPGGNPEELETLLKDLHRLIGIRPQPLEGIGQNREPQQHNGDQKGVATKAPQGATEAEQQQPGEEGVGDVEERLTEVAVMHQEHVVEAEPEREAAPTEGQLAVQNGALDLPSGRRKQRNGRRRHPEKIARAGEETFPERRLAGPVSYTHLTLPTKA